MRKHRLKKEVKDQLAGLVWLMAWAGIIVSMFAKVGLGSNNASYNILLAASFSLLWVA